MCVLSIIIPAYNEEEAIGPIIERCLAAEEAIIAGTHIDAVEIIVVNDGSTDRTAEIAAKYADIHVISYQHNKGYGAAIKKGFEAAHGEVLGFLDADGTCDPLFFSELCCALEREIADIAIGSRLNLQSQMPLVRRVGNMLYALLLGVLSNQVVTDTASGMRVIQRAALPKLYPLPDGMHFTPAMSARATLDDELTIVEVPMPYHERIGASKLKVLSDGFRFLNTILTVALTFHPARLFGFMTMPIALITVLYSIYPLELYAKYGRLEEWMLYRFITLAMLGLVILMLMSAGVICERVALAIYIHRRHTGSLLNLVNKFYHRKILQSVGLVFLMTAVILNYRTILQYFGTGRIHEHWSRVLMGAFLFSAAAHVFVTSVILHAIDLMIEKRRGENAYTSTSMANDAAMKINRRFGQAVREKEP